MMCHTALGLIPHLLSTSLYQGKVVSTVRVQHSSFLLTAQFRQKVIRGSSPLQKNSPKEQTFNTFKLLIINLKTVKKMSYA